MLDNAPSTVYNRVTEAWRLLLGENLHYGYFLDDAEQLDAATERLTLRMAEWAELYSGASVLDVGCGIGNPARLLAKRFGCHVTGISTSDVGLNHATQLTKQEKLEHVLFLKRDGMANEFPDSSFDRIWIMESSHLMPRKKDLITESARVLRRGGKLVLCDIILRNPIPFTELMKSLPLFRCLDAVFGTAKMETLSTYQDAAEEAELVVERLEDISDRTFATFRHWQAKAHANREKVIKLVNEEYWQQFVDACRYLTMLWQEKKLGYGMMLATKRMY